MRVCDQSAPQVRHPLKTALDRWKVGRAGAQLGRTPRSQTYLEYLKRVGVDAEIVLGEPTNSEKTPAEIFAERMRERGVKVEIVEEDESVTTVAFIGEAREEKAPVETTKRPDETYREFLERVGVEAEIVDEDPETATVIFFGEAEEEPERYY